MVVYQKFGVIGLTAVYAVLQKLKLQIFRLFILCDDSRNSSDCINVNNSQNNTDALFEEDYTSSFLYKSLLINNCLALLPCIFLAAWSDRHGRKLLLLLPFVGSLLSDMLMLAVLFIPSAPIDLLMLSEGIYGFFGGTVLITIGCMCYITDSTDHRLRTWFVGLILGLLNAMPVVDILLQYVWTPLEVGLKFRMLVLTGILIRITISILFLIYIKVAVVESVFILGSFSGNRWINLLTPINVSDTVNCVFKRRLDNMRFFIIVLTTIFIFYSVSLYGNTTAFPQYFRNVLEWSYKKLLTLSALFAACQTLTLWISTCSGHKWRLFDINLGICGSISLALSCLALVFTKSSWTFILGILAGSASLLIPTCIISVLSKLIERIETGSMYAGIGFTVLIAELIAVPSFNAISRICMEAGIPQVIFLVSFGFATFGLLFFIYLKRTISPDLLGHLSGRESLALINRKGQFEQLFE